MYTVKPIDINNQPMAQSWWGGCLKLPYPFKQKMPLSIPASSLAILGGQKEKKKKG